MRQPAGPGAATTTPSAATKEKKAMGPGHFSVNLTVKASKANKVTRNGPIALTRPTGQSPGDAGAKPAARSKR